MKAKDVPRNRRHAALGSPLLRKSAVHQKSRKARRRHDKVDLRKQWGPQKAFPGACFVLAPLRVA